MSGKVEGTIVLDGLIEGRLPDDETEAKLREWVRFAEGLKLPFHLETTDVGFSLLPDARPLSAKSLGDAPEHAISQALEQLLTAFPENTRARIFSTLRSFEYRKSEEVQSVYAVSADGIVNVHSRTLEARTTAPPESMSRKNIMMLGLIGLVAALALVGFASFFVDIPGLVSRLLERASPLRAEKIAVDANAFADFFTATPARSKPSSSAQRRSR